MKTGLTSTDTSVVMGVSLALLVGSGVVWVRSAQQDVPMPPKVERPAFHWPIDVNRASREELVRLPRVGPVLAERIEAGRPYTSVEELRRVKGIGPKTFERLRRYVTVGQAAQEARDGR